MKSREEIQSIQAPSDQELRLSALMKKAQSGDAQAYRELLFELNFMLQKFTKNAVYKFNSSHDESHALDITQEILLAVHKKRHTYDPNSRLLPWVYGIARHKLIDWQRKRLTDKKFLDFESSLESFETEQEFQPDDAALESRIAQGLESLPPKQRQAIELTKLQGKTVQEAASATGLSPANIKVLTHRGVLALKKILGAQSDK